MFQKFCEVSNKSKVGSETNIKDIVYKAFKLLSEKLLLATKIKFQVKVIFSESGFVEKIQYDTQF